MNVKVQNYRHPDSTRNNNTYMLKIIIKIYGAIYFYCIVLFNLFCQLGFGIYCYLNDDNPGQCHPDSRTNG